MSYILEALNKSQRERELGQIPKWHTEPLFVPEKQTSRWLITALIAAVVAALSALAFAAYLFFMTPATQKAPSSAPSAPPRTEQPAEPALQTPVTPKPIPVPAAQAPIPKPAPAPATQAPAPPGPVSSSTPEVTRLIQDKPAEVQRPGKSLSVPPAVSAPETEPLPPVTTDSKPKPPTPAARQIKREMIHSVPLPTPPKPIEPQYPGVHDLPVELRRDLPPLKILLYYYTEEPQARFVILDSQKLYQGERHDKSGIQVMEIRKQGMILKFHDQIFFKHR